MKEKEAKENQGVRDAGQICRVPAGAVRDASQIYRVPAGDVRDTDPIRHIRPIFPGLGRGLDLLLPSFLLSREEKKVLAGLRLSPIGAIWGAYSIRPYRQGWRLVFLSPFLSLMKEKEAKENQGVRDASQICRVRDVSMWCTRPFFPAPAGAVRDASQICRVLAGAAYALRPLTVLCDPLYKCAGRLRMLVGWRRGVMGRVWGSNDLHIIY